MATRGAFVRPPTEKTPPSPPPAEADWLAGGGGGRGGADGMGWMDGRQRAQLSLHDDASF